AKSLWAEVFSSLGNEIREGTPIIGLEPACVSAFRDELIALHPGDERAEQLSRQMLFLTEFLDRRDVDLSKAAGSALVQIHCHHHAVITTASEQKVLDRLGIEYEILASGCCGMAGAFGFETGKYDVSMTAAERVLLPAVRAAAPDTLVLANGFS